MAAKTARNRVTRTPRFTNDTERVNSLIEMASDFEDADSVVEEFTGLHTTREKLDYLLNNFDVRIIGGTEEGTIEEEYLVVLTAIVDHKWR